VQLLCMHQALWSLFHVNPTTPDMGRSLTCSILQQKSFHVNISAVHHQPTGFNMIQLVSFRLSHPIPINLETQLFLVATVPLVTTCDKHCTVAGSEHTKLTPGVGQVVWDGLPCACGKASALSPGCRRKNGNHMEMYDR
jgi:hypothetical protein